jgi:nucleotide-binding universal stress UspA family protein
VYRRILVPVDGSSVSRSGLDEAIGIAKSEGATLRILHVVDRIAFVRDHNVFTAGADQYRESGRKLMKEIMLSVAKHHVNAEAVTVENLSGRASDSIVKEAKKWGADLIIMGTHGRRGMHRLILGSDAELVIRTAPVPVLLVRGPKTRRSRKERKTK